MEENVKYLVNRVFVWGISIVSVGFLFLVALFGYALRTDGKVLSVMIGGVVYVLLVLYAIVRIVIPYWRIDRNIILFLSGYTAAGLKNPKYTISPATDKLFESVVRMLESDTMLMANKRQAQYLALQNQINPHFLYNTLESIRSEAMEAGMDNVMNMTEALANFFRYTISKVENLVTLEEEIQNIKTYFYIQQYRFEDRLQLMIDYEEEDHDIIFKCLVPKLTLQPVVENCIIHGLERKIGLGTVRIILRRTENRLLIQISDDGVGMTKERYRKLNQQLNQSVFESIQLSQKKGGIALVNVNNRIHLIFGEEYGMSVFSTPGIGTDTMINLPLATSKRQLKNGEDLV